MNLISNTIRGTPFRLYRYCFFMATLVIGSGPFSQIPSISYDQTFAANGAFNSLLGLSIETGVVKGVATPYLFRPNVEIGPFRNREPLRESAIDSIRAFQPEILIVRPGQPRAGKVSESEICRTLGYNPKVLTQLSHASLSSKILVSLGYSAPRRWGEFLSARFRCVYPSQDPRWKISTGVLGVLLALAERRPFPIVVAGIGLASSPYRNEPMYIANRAGHIEADLRFLKSVRTRFAGELIQVLDTQLDDLTKRT